MNHLLILGFGYTARRLAARTTARGWRVSGTRRLPDDARALRDRGVEGLVFDGTAPSEALAEVLPSVTHLVDSIPPDPAGSPVLRHHRDELRRAPRLRWAGLLSTTGVYGDHEGRWVDESTPPEPSHDRGLRRLAVERGWAALAASRGLPLQIFRLSGIYGPGRSAFDRIRSGSARRIVATGMVFNRVHVDDIVGAVASGMARPEVVGPVNVTDDAPASLHEVLTWAARRVGVAPPPEVELEEAELSPIARSFWTGSRRVANRRLRSELGYDLRYPTYREGLEAILEAGRVHRESRGSLDQ